MTTLDLKWRRTPPPRFIRVWVSIPKIDAAWRLSPIYYVWPGGKCENAGATPEKYPRAGQFLASGSRAEIPSIHLDEYNPDGIVFYDGRHRFAWSRDHGAVAIPVGVYPNEAAEISKRFGTTIRTCKVTLH